MLCREALWGRMVFSCGVLKVGKAPAQVRHVIAKERKRSLRAYSSAQSS